MGSQVWHSMQTASAWRGLHKRFRDLSSEHQEQVLFTMATLLGTLTFLVLFECFYRLNSYTLEAAETVFSVSYVAAYLISIVWQHALNRWLIHSFAAAPYWASLGQTYIVYSLSLAVMASAGAILISFLAISPRLVTLLTLPSSGVLNYYLLTFAMRLRDPRESFGFGSRDSQRAAHLSHSAYFTHKVDS